MTAEGRSINVTLIFSLTPLRRGDRGIPRGPRDVPRTLAVTSSDVHSVASFFVSRVDTEVDRRLDAIRHRRDRRPPRPAPAIAQAKLAYQLFRERFAGDRWDRLAAHGARLQRPLWASTSTKNPAYPDTLYVDSLIGPDTVNTLPEATIAAFEDHGVLARTIDADVDDAHEVMQRLGAVGIDMDDVGLTLEDEGVASFHQSFQDVLGEHSTPKPDSSRSARAWTGPAGRCSVLSPPRS